MLSLDEFEEELQNSLVEILTSEMSVSSSGNDLEYSLINREDRDIESTTSQVIDENGLLLVFLIESIGHGGSSWLVDDSEDVKTGDDTGVFGGLSLGIVEIGWDCDNGIDNSLS